MKNRLKKTKRLQQPLLRKYILWGALALLAVSQVLSFGYMLKLNQSLSIIDEKDTTNLINKLEMKRYKQAITDMSTGRVYIPEARLYIPLDNTNLEIMYDYRQSDQTNSADLYLSQANIVGNQILEDSHNCDKVVWISKNKMSSDTSSSTYIFVKEIPSTKDGLKYIYVHTKQNCSIYPSEVWDEIKTAVENIRNY